MSNEVGGPYISTADLVGVSLRDVLLEAGVRPGADQLRHERRRMDRGDAGRRAARTGPRRATGRRDERRGAAGRARVPGAHRVPGRYGFVSATKWVTGMELTTFAARRSHPHRTDPGRGDRLGLAILTVA